MSDHHNATPSERLLFEAIDWIRSLPPEAFEESPRKVRTPTPKRRERICEEG